MFKQNYQIKASSIRWHQFTRRSDAVFLSLGREISIGMLSVATLLVATPDSATARVSMAPVHADEATELLDDGVADGAVIDDEIVDGMPVDETVIDSSFTEKHIQLSCAEVTASRIPISSDKATRIIQTITPEDFKASSAQSVSDLLKLVAGIDVRQRGGFGIQTDIGVNGGNPDQVTVMLNGINISNPHTGHLTMDLPISLNDIERIEVIEGGASRVYGSSAFAGVVNIITKTDTFNNIGIATSGGSYGTFCTDGHINYRSGAFTNRISSGWSQSDGAAANSDFKKGNVFWNESYTSDTFELQLQTGFSSTKYGANTFYGTGSRSQYEENRRFLFALQGETKGRLHLLPQFYWHRTYDHYIWRRENPAAYENHHRTDVYGAHLNAWTQWSLGKTAIGIEFRRENILSSRLGKPIDPNDINPYPGYKYKDGRSNLGIYLEHNVLLDHWSISAGILANRNTRVNGGMRFYPGIDVSYSPLAGLRLYASFNQSLRNPTFTELYYNGPGLEANAALKSEKSTDYSVGCSFATSTISAKLKGFYRHETDMIDWVKPQGATIWTTANSNIDNMGVEVLVSYAPSPSSEESHYIINKVSVGYCYNYQHRINERQAAMYANQLVYLRHKFVAMLHHRIVRHLTAQWEFVYKDRTGWFDNAQTGNQQNYGSYGQLDLRVQWEAQHYTLYLQGNNLTGKHYYDIANVPQPGRWFTVGAKLMFDF